MKKLILPFFITAILTVLMTLGTGCKKDEPSSNEYIIKIDSIVHPDTINAGETLTVKFYGVIGNDGCHSFDRMEGNQNGNKIEVTTYGIYKEQDPCPLLVLYLDGAEFTISNLTPGEWIISAIQPSGPPLEGKVFVKE